MIRLARSQSPFFKRAGTDSKNTVDGTIRSRYNSLYGDMYMEGDVRDLMTVLKALADENRVRILWAVQGRELCICQIVELLGLAQSTVSKHVSILHQARLVQGRKEGRWMFYRAPDADSPVEAREIGAVVSELLATKPEAAKDAQRLKQIMKCGSWPRRAWISPAGVRSGSASCAVAEAKVD